MNLQDMIGIGVAGNFTGHLEQAGESNDFVNISTDEQDAPKGIFPFYLPKHPESTLSTFPLSPITIKFIDQETRLQVEPEMALICDIQYELNKIKKVTPRYFSAFNDCSIRKDGAKKISDKKHWGSSSKGISPNFIKIDKFEAGGTLDDYRLTCFLKRDGLLFEYGVDSQINTYSYFYSKLTNWIVEKLNSQEDFGPLECVSQQLEECKYPSQAIISIGATRYTNFGENSFLLQGDEIFVVLYPGSCYTKDEIQRKLRNGSYQSPDISTLHQIVI